MPPHATAAPSFEKPTLRAVLTVVVLPIQVLPAASEAEQETRFG